MENRKHNLTNILAKLKVDLKLKASECNKLSEDDLKRYEKLTTVLAKLNAGEKVYTSDLQRWLKDDYAKIASEWRQEKEHRAILADIPEELKDYQAKLRRGDFFANRRDGKRRAQSKADVMDDFADKAFDEAADCLREILEANPEYARYLDREVSLEAGSVNSIGHCEIGIPRLITSRSARRQCAGVDDRKRTLHDIKIAVVEGVLRDIVDSTRNIDVEKQSVQSDKLKKLLDNTGLDDELF